MFGIVLTILAIVAVAFGSFRIGAAGCFEDPDDQDNARNTATVLIAVGVMMVACGMLSLLGGGGMPFNALVPTNARDPLADLL